MTISQHTPNIFVWTAAAVVAAVVWCVPYAKDYFVSRRFAAQGRARDREAPTDAHWAATPLEGARQPLVAESQARTQGEPVVFAAVVRSEQARRDAGVPEKAASLFAGAAMRWTGQKVEWERRVAEMNLPRLHSRIPDEDDYTIMTFHARLLRDEIPSSRLDVGRYLKRLAASGGLTCGDVYRLEVSIDPSRFGFREF